MGTEAGLALIIDPEKAIAALGRFNTAIDRSSSHVSDFAGRVKRDFDFIGHAAGLVLKPLEAMIGVTAAVKASVLAVGIASLRTAGDFESLRLQLETILGTKARADAAFRESLTLAAKSPFSAKEIVQVRAELESVGIRGTKAVQAVAEAAAGMTRDIRDVAAAVKSLETEPLRRLGIQVKKEGEEFVFQFRDKMQQAQRVVATGWEEAQQAVLGIFLNKFEGGIERASRGIKGLWSNLGDALDAIRSTFAGGFLDEAKLFVNDLIEGIGEFRETARAAGVAFGDELAQARISLLAGFDVALQIAKQIGDVMQHDGGVGKIILESMELGAVVFGKAVLVAFESSLALWRTIGTILGEGVLEALRGANIPILSDAVRQAGIRGNLSGMEMSDLHRAAKQLGVSPIFRGKEYILGSEETDWLGQVSGPGKYRDVAGQKSREQLVRDIVGAIGRLPAADQLQWARRDVSGAIADSMKQAQGTVAKGISEFGDTAVAALQGFSDDLAEFTGKAPLDIIAAYEQAKGRIAGRTGQQLAEWNAILNPKEAAGEAGGGMYPGLPAWAIQGAARQARGAMIGQDVTADYAARLQDEIRLAGLSHEEQEKILIVRQADIEARRQQKELGLVEIGLIASQREEIEKLVGQLHETEKMKAIGDEIGYGFARGFSQATMHAKSLGDVLDYLGDAAMGVLERIMELTIWEPMAQSISTAVTNRITPRASGGSVYPGEWYLTGEMGPELVRFNRPGTVLPHHQTAARMGATQAPSVTVNVSNSSQAQVETTTQDVRFDGQRLVVGMLLKDKRNNGPYARSGRRT